MRMTIRASAAALGLAAALASGASAQEGPGTVIDCVNAMGASAQRLDQEVLERQRAGDAAAAQRLVLAAAIIRRAAEEFRGAEQNELPNKISHLPAPLPELALAAVAKAAELERTAAGQPGFVDGALKTFAALLAKLPTNAPHPILYGMLSGDLADPGSRLGSDLVVYGYRLTDPVLDTAPTVLFGKTELPPANVVVKGDRIEIALPADIKKAVDFAPPPCDSRSSFGVRIHEVHTYSHGFWPLVWRTEVENNTDFYALPSPVTYSAKVVASTESVSTITRSVDFREVSDLAIAQCEQTKAIEIEAPLPADATDAKCQAAWIDTAGASKIVSQCKIEGGNIHAEGAISAGAKVCSPEKVCACTVRAQGWLEATGTYKVLRPGGEIKTVAATTSTTFPAGGLVETQLPIGPGEVLRNATIEISRRACDKVADTINLPIGEDTDSAHSNVSSTGAFKAVLKNGALTLGAADAFPNDADKTP